LSYADLLRDPRWQKRRLEIFERDQWTCQVCGATDRELQVHHLRYRKGRLPWDHPDEDLQTLCRPCHRNEGIELVKVDREGSEHNDPSVWFRAVDGILEHGANNGAYCWPEPDRSKPNARVSIFCLPSEGDDSVHDATLEGEARTLLLMCLGIRDRGAWKP
jgi:hypothetical protein